MGTITTYPEISTHNYHNKYFSARWLFNLIPAFKSENMWTFFGFLSTSFYFNMHTLISLEQVLLHLILFLLCKFPTKNFRGKYACEWLSNSMAFTFLYLILYYFPIVPDLQSMTSLVLYLKFILAPSLWWHRYNKILFIIFLIIL